MLQPPTDNLYKFFALAGIFITVFSIGFTGQKFIEYGQQEIALVGQMKVAHLKMDASKRQVSDLESWKNSLEKNRVKSGKPIPRTELAKFSAEVNRLLPLLEEIKQRNTEIQNFADQVRHLKKWLGIYFWTTIIGSVLGILMALCGFALWYTRLQKFADAELKTKILPKRQPRRRP